MLMSHVSSQLLYEYSIASRDEWIFVMCILIYALVCRSCGRSDRKLLTGIWALQTYHQSSSPLWSGCKPITKWYFSILFATLFSFTFILCRALRLNNYQGLEFRCHSIALRGISIPDSIYSVGVVNENKISTRIVWHPSALCSTRWWWNNYAAWLAREDLENEEAMSGNTS